MSNAWVDAIAKAVAAGETKQQFAVPTPQYIGDLFFITDDKNKIIVALMWDGVKWVRDDACMQVQN
jgi:hypothetical protein